MTIDYKTFTHDYFARAREPQDMAVFQAAVDAALDALQMYKEEPPAILIVAASLAVTFAEGTAGAISRDEALAYVVKIAQGVVTGIRVIA